MKVFKKCRVIILPIDVEHNSLYGYKDESLLFDYEKDGYRKTESERDWVHHFHLYIISYEENSGGYLLNTITNNILSEGDVSMAYFNRPKYIKKIIATTDRSLNGRVFVGEDKYEEILFPGICETFIQRYLEEYNGGNIITDVMVEYENVPTYCNDGKPCNCDGSPIHCINKRNGWKVTLKVNPKDNTINIKRIKDSWSRDEVLDLLGGINDGMSDVYSEFDPEEEINKWEELNL